jgi:hypothetical protein
LSELKIFTVAIASGKSFCQVDIVNTTADVKADSSIIFRYIYAPNVLKVTGITDGKSLQIKASKLKIERTKDPFIFHAKTSLSGLDTVYLLNSGKVVFKKIFQLINSEGMKAQLGTITDSTATISQIITYPLLRVVVPNCKCFPGHVIGGFRIKFTSNHLELWERAFDVNGSRLDDPIPIIKKLRPKDKISFENIRTIDIDSSPWKLGEFTITIK